MTAARLLPQAAWALLMYIQANTGQAVRNQGTRGRLLDDAMAELAEDLQTGWYRDVQAVWQYDVHRKVNEMPRGVWQEGAPR